MGKQFSSKEHHQGSLQSEIEASNTEQPDTCDNFVYFALLL